MSAEPRDLSEPERATLAALLEIDDSSLLKLSRLTLPEIRAIKEEIARVLPAGNLPAFVLSGLTKLKGRRLDGDRVESDLTALMRGLDLVPKGIYGALVAGPAAVLHAYQRILELAGKDADAAFPEGTWQFYLQFGLREDAARHTCETTGFFRSLPDQARPAPMAAALVCAAIETLFCYDDLLLADWSERVALHLLLEEAAEEEKSDEPPFDTLARDWRRACPYHRPPARARGGAGEIDYLSHRQAVWQQCLDDNLRLLPARARKRFRRRLQDRQAEEPAAYLRQMTILAALQPDRYQERKQPVPLWQAAIALVWQGHTSLLPACRRDAKGCPLCFPAGPGEAEPIPLYHHPEGGLCDAGKRPLSVDRRGLVTCEDGQPLGALQPPEPETILDLVSGILSSPPSGVPPTLDLLMADSPRSLQARLRSKLPAATREEIAALRLAPIVVNWDPRPHDRPLAAIRRARRGIGDHPLTILRTDRSLVFDLSHIFFDGLWGMQVAEIMTDGAIHRYPSLASRRPVHGTPPRPLLLRGHPTAEALAQSSRRRGEAAAESADVDLRTLRRLRKWLAQRGVRLTVNDLLLLYRSLHAAEYEPIPPVRQALEAFHERAGSPEARAALESIASTLERQRETNPALLVPMSAGDVSPQERIFPTTFRNPLTRLRGQLDAARTTLRTYRLRKGADEWAAFDQARRELLAYLNAFGRLLDALKAVTMRGESFNTATIRMLGHLPSAMQHLLDAIPQHVGALNEIIKGNEVFSNVGRVPPGASVTRFSSAKDDGQTKELIWGIVTDDRERMTVSLRDFRPFVPLLLALGESALADLLAQDYVDTFARGFNRFVVDLIEIITLKR